MRGTNQTEMSRKEPCQKQACDIQKCLQENLYSEVRCSHVIEAMRRCCAAHARSDSVSCSGFNTAEPNQSQNQQNQQ
ncbi:cx9C motif-containing protein 4 [Denticeps clupeoides]|nr:cx9C motif-containing protein 4 [Denticeps clupeoides]